MKRKYTLVLTFMVVVCFAAGFIQAESDKEIFDRARLALFDRQWDKALKGLNLLTEKFPNSAYYMQALFYQGKCLEEKKMPKKALESFYAFLQISRNKSLKEEATVAIIDLNFQLYKKGEKKYLGKILGFLKSKQTAVQYYAAFKLSYAKDKPIAARAVPVLKRMIANESDEELVDRAKIALMRIDPKHLKKLSRGKSLENRVLKIRAYNKKEKRDTLSISIPFGLARLALEALPEEEKALLEEKGYHLDELLETLIESREIIRIEVEEIIFKIWIE